MRIRTRIYLLIGLALAALVIVGGTGIRSATNSMTAMSALGEVDSKKLADILYMRVHVNNFLRQFFLGGVNLQAPYEKRLGELQISLKGMQGALAELDKFYKHLDEMPKVPAGEALWSEFKNRYAPWHSAVAVGMTQRLAETLNDPSVEAFDKYQQQKVKAISANIQHAMALTELLGKFSDLVSKQIDDKVAADLAGSRVDITTLTVISALSILAAFVVGLTTLSAIMKPLEKTRATIVAVERGNDLTLKVDYDSKNEMGELVSAFNHLLDRLKAAFKTIQNDVGEVREAAASMSTAAKQVAASSEQQSSATSAMAASVEQMTISISTVAGSAGDAQTQAQEAGNVSKEGSQIIHKTTDEMGGIAKAVAGASGVITALGEESKQITSVVQVIKEVAEQTNLLALNAAIEAARAGDQGRGFAVVADEVRKLAERTAHSTGDISTMIENIQASANEAVFEMDKVVKQVELGQSLAQEAGKHMRSIHEQTENVSGSVTDISSALKEQSQASQEIARHVEGIAQMTDENSAAANETASTAQRLDKIAEEVSATIKQFKVA
ncbi:MAG: methyl-accepting chemotaxis protein [Azoarcus sp.]|jgi:methyl-accepting chemotaxis protein|nr:methyl-accepting chemotaxis protein [Azoarcus sp.]